MTLTTNVVKECKNEKHKTSLTQSIVDEQNRDMRGPKFTLQGTAPLRRPLVEKISFLRPKGALDPI